MSDPYNFVMGKDFIQDMRKYFNLPERITSLTIHAEFRDIVRIDVSMLPECLDGHGINNEEEKDKSA